MDDPREVAIMKRKVAEQLVLVTEILVAKEFPHGIEHDIRIRKAAGLFGDLYKSGPEGRELALDAVLTPEEREVAKQMKQKAPAKRGLLPWRHRGASVFR
jgi:hypothetical protein